MSKSTHINKKKRTTIASEVAEVFGCGDNYVRKVIRDVKREVYKGESPEAIRKAYWLLFNRKNKLLEAVEKLVPFKKAS